MTVVLVFTALLHSNIVILFVHPSVYHTLVL